MFLNYIKRNIRLYFAKKKWRRINSHNFTTINSLFDFELCRVGNYTYGNITIISSNNISKVEIGNFCSIAAGVKFIINNEHYTNYISTYPFKVKINHENREAYSKGDIIIDDDVWIGLDAKVMSGVHIGQGAVIAAGAVVTKDVPPYAIVGGVPAKVLKYRFTEEIIEELIKVDYSKFNDDIIKDHLLDLYKDVKELECFDWLPKKD